MIQVPDPGALCPTRRPLILRASRYRSTSAQVAISSSMAQQAANGSRNFLQPGFPHQSQDKPLQIGIHALIDEG